MKKTALFLLLLALICTLTACGCKHEWQEATCETPKTCSLCQETEGEPLGHSWVDATCEAPKTCTNCALTEGDALGHSWVDATCEAPKACTNCTMTEGEALGHQWNNADCQEEKVCTVCSFASGEFGPHKDVAYIVATGEQAYIQCICSQSEVLSAQDLMLRLLQGKWTLQAVQVDGKYYAPEPQTNWEEGTWLEFPSSAEPYFYQAGISELAHFVIHHDLSDFLAGSVSVSSNSDETRAILQCTALAKSSDNSSQTATLRLMLGVRDYDLQDYPTAKDFLEAISLSGERLMFLWRFTDNCNYIYGYEAE